MSYRHPVTRKETKQADHCHLTLFSGKVMGHFCPPVVPKGVRDSKHLHSPWMSSSCSVAKVIKKNTVFKSCLCSHVILISFQQFSLKIKPMPLRISSSSSVPLILLDFPKYMRQIICQGWHCNLINTFTQCLCIEEGIFGYIAGKSVGQSRFRWLWISQEQEKKNAHLFLVSYVTIHM